MNKTYRKKPLEIRAFQLTRNIIDQIAVGLLCIDGVILGSCPEGATPHYLIISTLEGDMRANIGDYIITGIKGEVYPCKPDIFEASYDEVKCSINICICLTN